jgi:hypothetical protein
MRLQRLVGEQLAGSLEIVFGDEDLAPAAKGRASEGRSRRDVGLTVEAVDALAAEKTAKSLGRTFVWNDGQPHRFSHKFIFALKPPTESPAVGRVASAYEWACRLVSQDRRPVAITFALFAAFLCS